MAKPHLVIILPGLGDDKKINQRVLRILTKGWKSKNVETYFFPIHWRDGKHFQIKLTTLLQTIDELALKHTISLVGTSAGASLAMNAFFYRPKKIHKVINVCGRLRAGHHTVRSLERMAKTSVAFKESVLQFEKAEKNYTKKTVSGY